jgi:citrate lyase beta subunit
MVAAFEAAEARGLGATSMDGKMIDTPIANQARRLLSIAAAIEKSETDS